MRFCDFFISYKIGLKSIEKTIPFTRLPLYRKMAVITIFSITIVSALFFMFKLYIFSFIVFGIDIISIVTFLIIDSRKNNLELMLKFYYAPYSEKRMDMVISVLNEYNIDFKNIDSLDLLIGEAKKAQIQCDYLLHLKKPLKTLSAIIFPIIVFVIKKIGNMSSTSEIITIALQVIIIVLLIFSLFFAIEPIVKDFLYRDYNKYSELIYDLRQIKLFYSKENPSH